MWSELQKKLNTETPDEKKVRHFNYWYLLLIGFIVVWMVGSFIYLNPKTYDVTSNSPVTILDAAGGINLSALTQTETNYTKATLQCVVRDHYVFGDIVIIKFFQIRAVVLDKAATSSDSYNIIYKDHVHTLQRITLPRAMLLSPANGAPPISLWDDY